MSVKPEELEWARKWLADRQLRSHVAETWAEQCEDIVYSLARVRAEAREEAESWELMFKNAEAWRKRTRSRLEDVEKALRALGHDWCSAHCDGDDHVGECERAYALLAEACSEGRLTDEEREGLTAAQAKVAEVRKLRKAMDEKYGDQGEDCQTCHHENCEFCSDCGKRCAPTDKGEDCGTCYGGGLVNRIDPHHPPVACPDCSEAP